MARLAWTQSAYAASDAALRTQLTALRDNLVTCGLVQTSDTGQFDMAAGVRSASANANFGFLMFRFNDALQATAPVFLKITLYNQPGTIGAWAFSITVGTGTDGAGTLANATTVGITNYTWSMTASNPPVHFMSGDGSRLVIASPNQNNAISAYAYLVIERTKSNQGTDTGEGVIAFWGGRSDSSVDANGNNLVNSTSAFAKQLVWLRSSGQYTYAMRGCNVPLAYGGYAANGSNKVYLYPWRPYAIREMAPALGVITGFLGEASPTLSTIRVNTYDGQSHEYIGFASTTGLATSGAGGNMPLLGDQGSDSNLGTVRYGQIFFRWE